MKKENNMQNVICFGAGGGAKRLYGQISKKYNILGFTDNDSKKVGEKIFSSKIYTIEECLKLHYEKIVITSAPGLDSIKEQLLALGINEGMLDDSFVVAPLESRRIFLERLSQMQKDIDSNICVAEAGVFEGDFAKHINCYYPNRELFLFDTFEGFCDKDIEKEMTMSNAKVGDYSNTNEEMVLSKMPFKEKCKIFKGYFPQTAENIDKMFCFVNLDLDLYEPTYNGLVFFEKRMVSQGIILVHDYFADNFKGPKEAVDTFIAENKGKYIVLPIGDGISVMVVGF